MIEKLLAALGVLVCGVLLVRLVLRPAQQRALDAWGRLLLKLPMRLVHRVRARRGAAAAIRRARHAGREQGEWDGNVYRPKSFKGPRKPH